MAETSTIARLAGKVSKEIFQTFGWKRFGAVDQNWECVTKSHEKESHPSDVVFFYEDPYLGKRIYWNVDLKSYAKTSITSASLAGALASLIKSTECANTSPGWQELYYDQVDNWRCDGLLFIYNHDGEYDTGFNDLIRAVHKNNFRIQSGRRVVIMGPPDVSYLASVANDIKVLRGDEEIPSSPKATTFWYPDLVRTKKATQMTSAATIEMLTGPWVPVRIPAEYNNGHTRFIVYYKAPGKTQDEFRYLLDSFFRFQMLTVDSAPRIEIRLYDPASAAFSNFERAKAELSKEHYGLVAERLGGVTCAGMPKAIYQFSQEEAGMEQR